MRDTTAAVDADPDDLGAVEEDRREEYAAEAQRMAAAHDPDDVIYSSVWNCLHT